MARRADREHSDEEQEDSELEADPNVRAKIIKKTRSKVSRLLSEIEAFNEQAKPLKKEVGAQFRTLRSKTGLTRKEAEHVFWQADLEEGERNDSLLRIREAFAAIGMGGVVDWIKATDETKARRGPEHGIAAAIAVMNGNGADHSAAFKLGFGSVTAADPRRRENPYKKGTKLYTDWMAGATEALENTTFETDAQH